MGKQTNISGSNYGGEWTKEKITIIDDYLKFYVRALSKQKVRLVYIDAFAGSGKTILSDSTEIEGAAVKSLQYDFDEYYFIEIDTERVESLKTIVQERFPLKKSKVHIINDNCNERLGAILANITKYQRGVMFLDPYALELDWSVLEKANQTGVLDIWYLFPLNAIVRNLPKQITSPNEISEKVDKILGTHDWVQQLYTVNNQVSMFDEVYYDRVNFDELVDFIFKRISSVFAYVSPNSRILRNSNRGPLFILFFMMSNKSGKAIGLGSKVVNQIFEKIDNMTGYYS